MKCVHALRGGYEIARPNVDGAILDETQEAAVRAVVLRRAIVLRRWIDKLK